MYKYTKKNLLKTPITYQFSDVSSDTLLNLYITQRKEFLKNSLSLVDKSFDLFASKISIIEYKDILKLQKKFEVKKSFFKEYSNNVSFIAIFSFQLSNYLKNDLCLSLFSTLLKLNDTLTSLKITDFSAFEIYLINNSIENELYLFERIRNE